MTSSGETRRVTLGVSGGIAAYKAAELVRRLRERGLRVRVVMTRGAREFVTPLTFAALSGEKVVTDLFSTDTAEATLDSAVEHIAVAQQTDLLLIAPATADLIAKFAHGLADDFLTTLHLAYRGPLALAPAMNTNMWTHPATAANLETLRSRGARVIEPSAGDLACGMVGPGRLAEPDRIAAAAVELLASRSGSLTGRSVLVTAGPTREPIDPVRFLSNRSSGKMGYALAAEAVARGAAVTLISGPVALLPPSGCEVVPATTTEEMFAATMERIERADIVIMAAAPADYRPASPAASKIKKSGAAPALDLEPTPDILAEVGRRKGSRLVIGFAAETENLEKNGSAKLRAKHCDLLVANLVGREAGGTGFDSDENQGLLLSASGEAIELPREAKTAMARRIWDAVEATNRR